MPDLAREDSAAPRASSDLSSLEEARAEDAQDLANARLDEGDEGAERPWWRSIGPGLITGAADDDPSGIGTYSVTGAQFGYRLLWLVPFCLPLMIAIQEMCGRIGVVTGKGLAAAIKEHYPRWMLTGAILLLIGANVTNIYADLNVMAASAQMLFHGTFVFWLTLLAAGIIGMQIAVPYRLYVRWLKWLCLALLGYVVTAFMPGTHNDWGQIARHLFMPEWQNNPRFLLTVVGFLGTTISPYLFFWQAGEEVEEEIEAGKEDAPGHRIAPADDREIRSLRLDTIIGMFASQAVTFFIILCTATDLHDKGITDINTAQDAARALLPLGRAAYWLFALGILGTGSLAIPTLAGSIGYAVAEANDWRYGLYRRFARARAFYLVIAAAVVGGYALNFVKSISPVKALLYSAAMNGVFAPPLIVILLLVCNNRNIFGNRSNGRLSNILGAITVVFMGAAAAILIWALITGRAAS
ncbi:MAG TPA: Nramp family divalent metal transporter [Chthonomonadaceae bacterium]|nr:Nramp family divalent metal transporter [Chthonomonadaceae bacterium]